MKVPLKQSVKQHLESKKLTAKQLQQLQVVEKNKENSVFSVFWMKTALIASIFVFSSISFYYLDAQNSSRQTIAYRIAEEVADNHLHLKPLEVNGNQLQKIKNYFTQLDFALVNPVFLESAEQSLLGGRYCSIQGMTAAQLRIKNNKTGDVQTLYETQYKKTLFKGLPRIEMGENPVSIQINGLNVDIWIEKDVLFALIRNVS